VMLMPAPGIVGDGRTARSVAPFPLVGPAESNMSSPPPRRVLPAQRGVVIENRPAHEGAVRGRQADFAGQGEVVAGLS